MICVYRIDNFHYDVYFWGIVTSSLLAQATAASPTSPRFASGLKHAFPVGKAMVSSQTQHRFRIIVDNVRDADRRHHLQQVRRDPFEQTSHALSLDRLHTDIPYSCVSRRMYRRALTLQSCPQQIERVDNTSSKGTAESTNASGSEISRSSTGILGRTLQARSVAPGEELFQVLEGGEVNGTIWKHAYEAHRETAVKGAGTLFPHVLGCCADQGIAVDTAFNCFALHPEFEGVDGVDTEPEGAVSSEADEAGEQWRTGISCHPCQLQRIETMEQDF